VEKVMSAREDRKGSGEKERDFLIDGKWHC